MARTSAKDSHRNAEGRVGAYLRRYGVPLRPVSVVIDTDLAEDTLATHRLPATVVVRQASAPESVVAHELVHIAQGTLQSFRGFHLLYTLLAEGLADWVAKRLYAEHEVRYPLGYRLVDLLARVDEASIGDLLRLNDLPLAAEDVDAILENPSLPPYTRTLLGSMVNRIRDAAREASTAGITDPTFVTLGEEVRAWKFLRGPAFDEVSGAIDRVLTEFFPPASA